MYEFGERTYTNFIVIELIRKIRCAPSSKDPISVINSFYWEIDDISLHSDNPITERFAKTVNRIVGDIEDCLWADEDKRRGKVDMGDLIYNMWMKEDANVSS